MVPGEHGGPGDGRWKRGSMGKLSGLVAGAAGRPGTHLAEDEAGAHTLGAGQPEHGPQRRYDRDLERQQAAQQRQRQRPLLHQQPAGRGVEGGQEGCATWAGVGAQNSGVQGLPLPACKVGQGCMMSR